MVAYLSLDLNCSLKRQSHTRFRRNVPLSYQFQLNGRNVSPLATLNRIQAERWEMPLKKFNSLLEKFFVMKMHCRVIVLVGKYIDASFNPLMPKTIFFNRKV
jgi:hypothetical protein